MGLTRPRAYQIFDLDYKQSVRVISLSNITLSGGAPTVVDGVTLSANDRILVAGQSDGAENGLYYVTTLGTGSNGTWSRSVDGDQTGEIDAGMIVMVTEGSTYADTQWKLTTNDPITIGTTALTFEQNSAFAFGNIYANGTAVLADIVGDTVTFTPANNLIITGNALSDTITFEVSQSPTFTGNVTGANLITAGQVTATGNITGGNLITSGLVSVIGQGSFTGGVKTSSITSGVTSITLYDNTQTTINVGGASTLANIKGTLNVVANANVGNLGTDGLIVATGNITGGNLTTTGTANIGTLAVTGTSALAGNVTITGHVLPAANVVYDLGSPENRWRSIYVGANTIDIGGATISADLVTGSLILTGPDGAEFILTGSDALNAEGAFGFVSAGNAAAATSTTTGALQVAGGAGIGGNIYAGGLINAAGNITGGNLTTAAQVVATGNVTGGNINTAGQVVASGNITADYFFGNISQATGISAPKISNGTSEANIVSSGGNLAISIGGTSNIVVVSSAGLETTGTLQATGNVTGGNIVTAGQVSGTKLVIPAASNSSSTNESLTTASGNIGVVLTESSFLVTTNLSGIGYIPFGVSNTTVTIASTATIRNADGNVTVPSYRFGLDSDTGIYRITTNTLGIAAGGQNTAAFSSSAVSLNKDTTVTGTLTATGNITGGNISGTNIVGTLETAAQPNVTSLGTLTSLDVSGNITGGNLKTSAVTIGSSGAVSGITTLSASGNANIGNLGAATVVATTLTGTLSTAAQTNITSVGTLSSLTVSGNIAGGNLSGTLIAGTLSTAAQPNVTSLGTLSSLTVSGNISGANLIASANVDIQSRSQIKFYDSDNSNFISLRAPATVAADYVLTLPNGYGNADQVLSTNGAGTLTWVDQSGGGGGGAASFPNSTVAPVPGADGNFDLSYNYAQTVQEVPFETSATDAFGVNLGEVYSMMDPGGDIPDPTDLGVLT